VRGVTGGNVDAVCSTGCGAHPKSDISIPMAKLREVRRTWSLAPTSVLGVRPSSTAAMALAFTFCRGVTDNCVWVPTIGTSCDYRPA